MHNVVEEVTLTCPVCNAAISVLVDGSAGDQSYIEDCEVCCRPLLIGVTLSGEGIESVQAQSAD